MISINLIPEKKSWFPFWILFDLSVVSLVAGLGFVILSKYQTDVDFELENKRASLAEIGSDIGDLDPLTAKYSELKNYETKLATQIDEVRTKALSQFVRYRPVILLEHLQNLRPAGLWFQNIQMMNWKPDADSLPVNSESPADLPVATESIEEGIFPATQKTVEQANAITIEGFALDNIILSDFLSALRATETHDVISGDLRTNLYFRTIGLENSLAQLVELNMIDTPDEIRKILSEKIESNLANIKLQKFRLVVEYGERGLSDLENKVGSSLIIANSEG